ncbi:hypothetical protein KOW79_016568 [Hemibagrus wyckioides]|uniref:Uncharacterized protein n=1 Tax=Hemibagrus wyckioides TaxID=337641 RepID=A0A9D3NE95_9TELE|nr:hypothetical protein KOW79_016568 [Hemibagrus wyckioides]
MCVFQDTWDEELNDDLLRSDEDDPNTSGVSSHLEFGAKAEEAREQAADDEDVFDVQINEPLDNIGSFSVCVCKLVLFRGFPWEAAGSAMAGEENRFRQQEFDECWKTETTATVMRFFTRDARKHAVEALDAWQSRVKETKRPAEEGRGHHIRTQVSPVCVSDVSDTPVLARNTPFISTIPLRPVAMGMPGAASHRVSARAEWCARTAPEPTPTDKNQGQEVKKDFPSPLMPHLLTRAERHRERQLQWECMEHFCSDDDDDDEKEEGVPEWYWLCLEEQKRMREQIIKQKERRRLLQARKRKSEFPTRVQVPSVPQFSSHLLKNPEPEIHTCTSLFHSDSHDQIVLTASGPVPRLQDEDVAVSRTCPAQLSENSRVVTFTRPWTPHAHQELRPGLRRRGAAL